MSWIGETWRRVGMLVRGEKFARELEEEMRGHREMKERELSEAGVDAEEARHRAAREFGNATALREWSGDTWGWRWLRDFGNDVRFGTRMLRKNLGFTIVVVLTLALGIGATTAIFSVMHRVLLKPLPYPNSNRVIQMILTQRGQVESERFSFSDFRYFSERNQWFQTMAAFTPLGMTLEADGEGERANVLCVSADYFQVLGMQPFMGRSFLPEEDTGSGTSVTVLSNAMWKRRFASDAAIAGKNIVLDGRRYQVVGVMAAGFESQPVADLWTPLAQVAQTAGNGQNLKIFGRLRDELTLDTAQARLDPSKEAFLRLKNVPNRYFPELRLVLVPFQKNLTANISQAIFILLGAVSCVLLIACANVTNLLLARGSTRTKELGVRTLLGASRGRLCRQLLTESLLLAVLGGASGLLLARGSLASLLRLAPKALPRASEISVDGWTVGGALLIVLAAGVFLGLASAIQTTSSDLGATVKEGVGRGTSGGRRTTFRKTLVGAEVAVSFVLLVGAGLLSVTLVNLVKTNVGFDASRVLSVEIWVSASRYRSTAEMNNYYRGAIEAVERVRGVEAASVVVAGQPLEFGGNLPLLIHPPDEIDSVDYRSVSPGYFGTLGEPLQRGRIFTEADSEGSQPVAIVNETFMRRYFQDREALGQKADLGQGEHARVIVGVVGDVKSFVGESAAPAVFVPAAQASFEVTRLFNTWFPTHLLVRTAGEPTAVARAVENALRATDPFTPIGRIRSMDEVLSSTLSLQQFMSLLLGVFAGLAVVLAAVGVYGVMSYSMVQRTAEMGLRIALGASRKEILQLALKQALLVTFAGIGMGLAGSLALARTLAGLLYGVSASDGKMLLLCGTVMFGVALAASYIPVRRAMRVDPMVALKHE